MLRTFQSKIYSPSKIIQVCKKIKDKKIVFTNGCFDLVHVGHVCYLQQARKKGDFLVVVLDTDLSVRKLKGKGRPINTLKNRMAVLAALECVDAVTWFSGSNPLPMIEKIHPHVLVKGGDWLVHKIIGSEQVLSWGGEVFALPYVKGYSTTKLVQKISF